MCWINFRYLVFFLHMGKSCHFELALFFFIGKNNFIEMRLPSENGHEVA